MAVRYSVAALVKAGAVRGNGRGLLLVTKSDPLVAVEVFRQAAQATEKAMEESMDDDHAIGTSSYAPTPAGPVGIISLCDSKELLATWLASVAARLEAAGIAGRIQLAAGEDPPRIDAPAMIAGIQLELDHDAITAQTWEGWGPTPSWYVTAERTRRVLPTLVAWCLDGGPADDGGRDDLVHVFTGTGFQVAPEQAEAVVLATVPHASTVRLVCTSPDRRRQRRLITRIDGAVILSVYDQDLSWAQRWDLLQEPLRAVAGDAVHALVRPTAAIVGLDAAWNLPPTAPIAVQCGGVGVNLHIYCHLMADHVPDAYLQQVLTTAHLDRIGHLPDERWVIEDLGGGRHLVTARDPDPWLVYDQRPYVYKNDTENLGYAETRPAPPDPETLARARADFDPALITLYALRAHPTPAPEPWREQLIASVDRMIDAWESQA